MEHGSYGRAAVGPGTSTGPVALNEVALREVEPDDHAIEPVRRRASLAQRGMVSAEWAVGIIAAVAIAGVLFSVVTSGPVERLLLKVILTVIGTFAKIG